MMKRILTSLVLGMMISSMCLYPAPLWAAVTVTNGRPDNDIIIHNEKEGQEFEAIITPAKHGRFYDARVYFGQFDADNAFKPGLEPSAESVKNKNSPYIQLSYNKTVTGQAADAPKTFLMLSNEDINYQSPTNEGIIVGDVHANKDIHIEGYSKLDMYGNASAHSGKITPANFSPKPNWEKKATPEAVTVPDPFKAGVNDPDTVLKSHLPKSPMDYPPEEPDLSKLKPANRGYDVDYKDDRFTGYQKGKEPAGYRVYYLPCDLNAFNGNSPRVERKGGNGEIFEILRPLVLNKEIIIFKPEWGRYVTVRGVRGLISITGDGAIVNETEGTLCFEHYFDNFDRSTHLDLTPPPGRAGVVGRDNIEFIRGLSIYHNTITYARRSVIALTEEEGNLTIRGEIRTGPLGDSRIGLGSGGGEIDVDAKLYSENGFMKIYCPPNKIMKFAGEIVCAGQVWFGFDGPVISPVTASMDTGGGFEAWVFNKSTHAIFSGKIRCRGPFYLKCDGGGAISLLGDIHQSAPCGGDNYVCIEGPLRIPQWSGDLRSEGYMQMDIGGTWDGDGGTGPISNITGNFYVADAITVTAHGCKEVNFMNNKIVSGSYIKMDAETPSTYSFQNIDMHAGSHSYGTCLGGRKMAIKEISGQIRAWAPKYGGIKNAFIQNYPGYKDEILTTKLSADIYVNAQDDDDDVYIVNNNGANIDISGNIISTSGIKLKTVAGGDLEISGGSLQAKGNITADSNSINFKGIKGTLKANKNIKIGKAGQAKIEGLVEAVIHAKKDVELDGSNTAHFIGNIIAGNDLKVKGFLSMRQGDGYVAFANSKTAACNDAALGLTTYTGELELTGRVHSNKDVIFNRDWAYNYYHGGKALVKKGSVVEAVGNITQHGTLKWEEGTAEWSASNLGVPPTPGGAAPVIEMPDLDSSTPETQMVLKPTVRTPETALKAVMPTMPSFSPPFSCDLNYYRTLSEADDKSNGGTYTGNLRGCYGHDGCETIFHGTINIDGIIYVHRNLTIRENTIINGRGAIVWEGNYAHLCIGENVQFNYTPDPLLLYLGSRWTGRAEIKLTGGTYNLRGPIFQGGGTVHFKTDACSDVTFDGGIWSASNRLSIGGIKDCPGNHSFINNDGQGKVTINGPVYAKNYNLLINVADLTINSHSVVVTTSLFTLAAKKIMKINSPIYYTNTAYGAHIQLYSEGGRGYLNGNIYDFSSSSNPDGVRISDGTDVNDGLQKKDIKFEIRGKIYSKGRIWICGAGIKTYPSAEIRAQYIQIAVKNDVEFNNSFHLTDKFRLDFRREGAETIFNNADIIADNINYDPNRRGSETGIGMGFSANSRNQKLTFKNCRFHTQGNIDVSPNHTAVTINGGEMVAGGDVGLHAGGANINPWDIACNIDAGGKLTLFSGNGPFESSYKGTAKAVGDITWTACAGKTKVEGTLWSGGAITTYMKDGSVGGSGPCEVRGDLYAYTDIRLGPSKGIYITGNLKANGTVWILDDHDFTNNPGKAPSYLKGSVTADQIRMSHFGTIQGSNVPVPPSWDVYVGKMPPLDVNNSYRWKAWANGVLATFSSNFIVSDKENSIKATSSLMYPSDSIANKAEISCNNNYTTYLQHLNNRADYFTNAASVPPRSLQAYDGSLEPRSPLYNKAKFTIWARSAWGDLDDDDGMQLKGRPDDTWDNWHKMSRKGDRATFDWGYDKGSDYVHYGRGLCHYEWWSTDGDDTDTENLYRKSLYAGAGKQVDYYLRANDGTDWKELLPCGRGVRSTGTYTVVDDDTTRPTINATLGPANFGDIDIMNVSVNLSQLVITIPVANITDPPNNPLDDPTGTAGISRVIFLLSWGDTTFGEDDDPTPIEAEVEGTNWRGIIPGEVYAGRAGQTLNIQAIAWDADNELAHVDKDQFNNTTGLWGRDRADDPDSLPSIPSNAVGVRFAPGGPGLGTVRIISITERGKRIEYVVRIDAAGNVEIISRKEY